MRAFLPRVFGLAVEQSMAAEIRSCWRRAGQAPKKEKRGGRAETLLAKISLWREDSHKTHLSRPSKRWRELFCFSFPGLPALVTAPAGWGIAFQFHNPSQAPFMRRATTMIAATASN
jgi:hypothetical protein